MPPANCEKKVEALGGTTASAQVGDSFSSVTQSANLGELLPRTPVCEQTGSRMSCGRNEKTRTFGRSAQEAAGKLVPPSANLGTDERCPEGDAWTRKRGFSRCQRSSDALLGWRRPRPYCAFEARAEVGWRTQQGGRSLAAAMDGKNR